MPDYPAAARRAEATGTTRLSFLLQADGSVSDVRVDRASGSSPAHALLDEATVSFLRGCRFKPKRADAPPSDGRFRIDMVWKLDGPENDLDRLRREAKAGSADAQFRLGDRYVKGTGVMKDDAQAVVLFRSAAEQGFTRGQAALGWMYENGHGVPRDDAQAATWYREAAQKGDAWAQSRLAWFYRRGWGGLAKDNTAALDWFAKAAAQGHSDSLFQLGQYQVGGRRPNKALGWTYLKLAADRGHLDARHALDALALDPAAQEAADALARQWKPGAPLPSAADLPPPPQAEAPSANQSAQ